MLDMNHNLVEDHMVRSGMLFKQVVVNGTHVTLGLQLARMRLSLTVEMLSSTFSAHVETTGLCETCLYLMQLLWCFLGHSSIS